MSDEQLKKHFDALREDEAATRPSYAHLIARHRDDEAPDRIAHWLRIGLPALAATAAVLWLLLPPGTPVPTSQPGSFTPVRWAMPTDVLLNTPGSDLLRDFPNLGTGPLLDTPLITSDSNLETPG